MGGRLQKCVLCARVVKRHPKGGLAVSDLEPVAIESPLVAAGGFSHFGIRFA